MKAGRNKTIDISLEEGVPYLERCIKVEEKKDLSEIVNKTICGDSFEVMKNLPEKFADLLIVDPPYNMDKDFSGKSFKKMTDEVEENKKEEDARREDKEWRSLKRPDGREIRLLEPRE